MCVCCVSWLTPDAADDAFASFLLYRTLASKLEEEQVKMLATEVMGAIEGQTSSSATATAKVKPSEQRAFDLFVSGIDMPQLAKQLQIKEASVQ